MGNPSGLTDNPGPTLGSRASRPRTGYDAPMINGNAPRNRRRSEPMPELRSRPAQGGGLLTEFALEVVFPCIALLGTFALAVLMMFL